MYYYIIYLIFAHHALLLSLVL